jgi:hypothetical protein
MSRYVGNIFIVLCQLILPHCLPADRVVIILCTPSPCCIVQFPTTSFSMLLMGQVSSSSSTSAEAKLKERAVALELYLG